MVHSPQGLLPQPGLLPQYLADMPELQRPDMPEMHLEVLEPLVDSAEQTPADWIRIAQAIVKHAPDFDGFVVLHGTDTMTHTASALSFLLPGLSKPVVLTGSQLSLVHARSDGREHIITSIIVAGTLKIPEVCIYFGSRLLRGNRAQKVDSADFVAFDSGNLAPLATVGTRISVQEHLVRAPGKGLPDAIAFDRQPNVAALRVFPGITSTVLAAALAPGTDGLVLETYGAGTFPSQQASLLATIQEATARQSPPIIMSCSQCHGGAVRQDAYRSSRALGDVGVMSAYDMTPEATLTKLYCLLASGTTPAQTRAAMGRSIAGEMTLPDD